MERQIILTGNECEEYNLLNKKFDDEVNKFVKTRIGEIKFMMELVNHVGTIKL